MTNICAILNAGHEITGANRSLEGAIWVGAAPDCSCARFGGGIALRLGLAR